MEILFSQLFKVTWKLVNITDYSCKLHYLHGRLVAAGQVEVHDEGQGVELPGEGGQVPAVPPSGLLTARHESVSCGLLTARHESFSCCR